MKYANSLKYMNSFECAPNIAEISAKRAGELCARLGRINLGTPTICLPDDSAGHACAIMLESVMICSGHRVGRITSVHGYDSRASIIINGEAAPIEDFNKAVTELKSAVAKDVETTYYKEEVTFVLGLLLCKILSCEYIMLEGLSGEGFSLDALCAPYDLIVMPTVYECEGGTDKVKVLCDAIRRGTREVVSGNQKSEIYNRISNACVLNGNRLYIPLKAQFEVTECSSRHLSFSYGGRDGYCLNSPSYILRDCAMTVIECALALRRRGVKMPWSGIAQGLSAQMNTGCFDIMSVSPLVVLDTAGCIEEIELLVRTGADIFGSEHINNFSACIPEEMIPFLKAFDGRNIKKLCILSRDGKVDTDKINAQEITVLTEMKDMAAALDRLAKDFEDTVCFGGVRFIYDLKAEVMKILNSVDM